MKKKHKLEQCSQPLELWKYSGEKKEGAWYWVAIKQGNEVSVFPAIYSTSYAGGWSNDDTWEDFRRLVFAWKKIEDPGLLVSESSEK